MRIELHNNLRAAQSIEANRVVVYDDFDNPIAAVVHIESGHYVATTAADKNFMKILQALGITKSLIVDKIDIDNLPPLR